MRLEKAQNIVAEWKAAEIYPFTGEAATFLEQAERQLFDIVAVNVEKFIPDLAAASTKARSLHLRMLRLAIERGPDDLLVLLREVLELPERKQRGLAHLLQETSLAAVITAAKTVASRLKFIAALESILFGTETKERLKARSRLDRVLAENTWVFGEEYNLWGGDKAVRRVLEKHLRILGSDIIIDDPVEVTGEERGIVDLMLSRSVRGHRWGNTEHLIVELKVPQVVMGAAEVTQAERFAMAVSMDERFRTVPGIRWHFWALSNSYNEFARRRIGGGPDPERRLVLREENVAVGIKTWAELIEENRARLQFFQEQLQHSADESVAMRYLQERHSEYLRGVVETDNEGDLGSEGGDDE